MYGNMFLKFYSGIIYIGRLQGYVVFLVSVLFLELNNVKNIMNFGGSIFIVKRLGF